jgi:hypothetical protein
MNQQILFDTFPVPQKQIDDEKEQGRREGREERIFGEEMPASNRMF